MLLLAAAIVVTFWPAATESAECGTWVSPEWSESATRELVDETESFAAEYGDFGGAASQAEGFAAEVVANYRECASVLDGRRNTALVLALLSVAISGAVLFVAAGRGKTVS